jgi:hypothetical protein
MAQEFLDVQHNFNIRNQKMYYKNINEFTKQKPGFEPKFRFEPGSVRFGKILKFAEPRTEPKVWFGPSVPEPWTEL